jgi:hypothetical protein
MYTPPEIRCMDEKTKKIHKKKHTPPETCGKEGKTPEASFRHSPSR